MRSIPTNYSRNLLEKVIFFIYFLSLIVSSWRHGLQMADEADEVLPGKRPRQQAAAIKNHGKCENLRTLSREYDCLAKIGTKKSFTLLLGNWVKRQRRH